MGYDAGMTTQDREVLATAERLGVPVPMVDTRSIPDGSRVAALNTQVQAFGQWFVSHGLNDVWPLQGGWLFVGTVRFHVEDMRAVLLVVGTGGLLRLVTQGKRGA